MNRVFTILATLSLVILMGASSLYAKTDKLKIDVPFDFVVAGETFPAGDYSLVRISDNSQLYRIQGRNTDQGAVIYALPVRNKGQNEKSRAVFRLKGQQYQLAEFYFQGRNESLVLISTSQTVAGLRPTDQ